MNVIYAQIHLPVFIFDATVTLRVAVKNKRKPAIILHIFIHNVTNITCIANRIAEGGSAQKIAYFIHRSICGAADIQLPNWSEICGYRGMAGGLSVDRWMAWIHRWPRTDPWPRRGCRQSESLPPLVSVLNVLPPPLCRPLGVSS